uniref:Glycoprotein hormone subunit beta domain-containing protein n=1 Tax=Serinus canaria TaxID=9135 RepID=A0A8C9L0J3_SERCA
GGFGGIWWVKFIWGVFRGFFGGLSGIFWGVFRGLFEGSLGHYQDPVYRSPLGPPRQAACTYSGVRYERWILGGCPPGTDPAVTVPVALGCRCGRCPMASADCAVLGLGPSFCGAPGGFGGS